MRRTIRHKSSRFIPLLLVAVMIFGMLQMQVLAAGIDTVPVTMTDEIDTNDQTNAGEVETNSISEEPLAGAEAVVQEEAVITASEQPFGLDPEEETCLVAFDPDDGKTGYNGFFKVTVPIDSTVTEKPTDPSRDGYFFKGWYAYLDENHNPVLWNFETDTVQENTTLWAAWEKACLVVFDPDDGKTGYNGFFKVTVPIDGTVTDKPADPSRDGYLFKGWYAYLDENHNPVLWNFETDTVVENTTLWAAWEEACLVVFDPDDGETGYNDFFKVKVPIGSIVTSQPEKPTRDGYLFKGWYAYLDENDNPVLWNFKTDTVMENTTLWAAWEEACLVVFDPDDGKTGYNDFFKVKVPIGSTVTNQPEKPTRDGYLFKGWYAYLDENGNPVLWNFSSDTVTENTTLWAAWEKETGGGENNGNENNGGEDNGNNGNGNNGNGNNGNGNNGNGNNGNGNNGNGNNGNGNNGNGNGNNGSSNNGNGGGDNSIEIGDEKTPGGSLDLDDIPKTSDNGFGHLLLWLLCGISASGMITLALPRKRSSYLTE